MNPRRRGVMLMDAVIALGVMGAILTVLLTATGQFRGGMRQLDDQRRAARAAEGLGDLVRRGREPAVLQLSAADQGCTVEVADVKDAAAPPGLRWVQVRVSRQKALATLVTLAPTGTAAEASP